MPDRNNSGQEKLILQVHKFRGEGMAVQLTPEHPENRRNSERGQGSKEHLLSDLLPSSNWEGRATNFH